MASLSIAKNRHGSTGEMRLRFTKKFMRFENFVQAAEGLSAPAAPAFD